MAFDQMRLDMPKASFDTRVCDPSFVSFKDGVFTVQCRPSPLMKSLKSQTQKLPSSLVE